MEDQELQEATKATRSRALTIAGILKGSEYSLTLFSAKEVATLEIFERNGKPYLNCLGSLKPRPAKPEEIVRQLYIQKLIDEYGYTRDRIAIEKQVYRRSLITDAGQLVPGWLAEIQGVEFFVHSPFACRTDDGSYVERNDGCLVLHATFLADGTKTRVFFGADIREEPLSEIIRITRSKKREERLESDIVKIPHHSSYLSLGPEKGTTKTKPTEDIAYLYEKKLLWRATLISTSKPIPTNDDDNQPPHRQAANYYREQADAQGGAYIVTMENPKASAPETLVIEITGSKAKQKKGYAGGLISAVSQPTPRAGNSE